MSLIKGFLVLFETEQGAEDAGLTAPIVLGNPEDWPFLIICVASMPSITLHAVASVRAPCMARHRLSFSAI